MSPQAVNSFVTDLVEMAKAMDQVPVLEAEIARLKAVEADLIQAKDYAANLEQRLHNAEVAKDQAETMFLELDEKAGKAIHLLNGLTLDLNNAQSEIARITDYISPPKPEPQPEPVKVEITETKPNAEDFNSAWDKIEGKVAEDQSEPDPTAHGASTTQTNETTGASIMENASSLIEPNPGPYSNKHYYDHPTYLSLAEWLAGGGSEADYNWRPNVSNWA